MNTDKLLWIVMVLIAGAFLPIQAGLNSPLPRESLRVVLQFKMKNTNIV